MENAINEAVLDVIGKFRKVKLFKAFETRKLLNQSKKEIKSFEKKSR